MTTPEERKALEWRMQNLLEGNVGYRMPREFSCAVETPNTERGMIILDLHNPRQAEFYQAYKRYLSGEAQHANQRQIWDEG